MRAFGNSHLDKMIDSASTETGFCKYRKNHLHQEFNQCPKRSEMLEMGDSLQHFCSASFCETPCFSSMAIIDVTGRQLASVGTALDGLTYRTATASVEMHAKKFSERSETHKQTFQTIVLDNGREVWYNISKKNLYT